MKSVYTSPLFWSAAWSQAKRAGAQFGFAFFLAMVGRAMNDGFQSMTINVLDWFFWIFMGMVLSYFTSVMFPKQTMGPCFEGVKNKPEL